MFKRVLSTLPVACLVASMAFGAQNPFSGDWKLDSSRSRTPDEMKVALKEGNTYVFDFGGGAETILADGNDHEGLQGTLLSVQQEAPDTWIVKRKMGERLLLRATWKLSADGKTLTDYYREFDPDGTTISLDYVYERTGGTGSGLCSGLAKHQGDKQGHDHDAGKSVRKRRPLIRQPLGAQNAERDFR